MNKNTRQTMAARMARGANDDVPRDQVNLVTPMTSPDAETGDNTWTGRLVLFLRVMAVLSMIKGLYHWAEITGFIGGEDRAFEAQTTQWQTATVYFAVIELMFPTIYGGNLFAVLVALILLAAYLVLAWLSARERPP
jgi:hypothetical protein